MATSRIHTRIAHARGADVLVVEGQLDLTSIGDLRAAILAALAGTITPMELDCTGLRFTGEPSQQIDTVEPQTV